LIALMTYLDHFIEGVFVDAYVPFEVVRWFDKFVVCHDEGVC